MNMKPETKKDLFTTFEKLRDEINSINKDLNRKNDEKESWFRKKDSSTKDIREKIASIRESKQKRDNLTKKVKELKEKRNVINQDINKKISEFIKLKNETKNLGKKLKVKNPFGLKGKIDHMEVRLETEVMPFEKEKSLSKKIKLFKKMLEEASMILGKNDKIKNLNSEIDIIKKNSNEVHAEIQELAAESQKLHESLIKNSKEVDKLNVIEKDAYKNFIDSKKSFKDINARLEEKLSKMNGIREKIRSFQLEEDENRKLRESTLIKMKEQEIEEKIKTGKKITNDDFLMFQDLIKGKS